jgi:GNAT superfamily N-acetyltransferase
MNSTALDSTLAERPGFRLVTRDGVRLRLHPAEPVDGTALGDLLASLTPEDVRFRFLLSREEPDAEQVGDLVTVDHRRTEHLLAIDEVTHRPVASLMIAADPQMETAEVAVAVAPGARGRGIGWALLNHAADLARERGIKKLRSVESRANHDALEIEEALGFRAHPVAGDPSLVMLETDLA